jgi:hypothetical protein
MEIMQRHEKEKNMPNIEIKVTKKKWRQRKEKNRTEECRVNGIKNKRPKSWETSFY